MKRISMSVDNLSFEVPEEKGYFLKKIEISENKENINYPKWIVILDYEKNI